MRGAIPPLPDAPAWRGAQLKAQGQLYLSLYLTRDIFSTTVGHVVIDISAECLLKKIWA